VNTTSPYNETDVGSGFEDGARLLTGFWETLGNTDDGDSNPILACGNDEYLHKQYYRSGAVSLLLTIANILLIWISGMLMFR